MCAQLSTTHASSPRALRALHPSLRKCRIAREKKNVMKKEKKCAMWRKALLVPCAILALIYNMHSRCLHTATSGNEPTHRTSMEVISLASFSRFGTRNTIPGGRRRGAHRLTRRAGRRPGPSVALQPSCVLLGVCSPRAERRPVLPPPYYELHTLLDMHKPTSFTVSRPCWPPPSQRAASRARAN